MRAAWQRLSLREQRLLSSVGMLILAVIVFSLIWQPTRQRLGTAERQYQQQLTVAAQLHQAQPQHKSSVDRDQPLSLRISESVSAAGLELHQMDVDKDRLRLSISGEASALLRWLDRVERDGVALQSLTLEKRDAVLEARLVL